MLRYVKTAWFKDVWGFSWFFEVLNTGSKGSYVVNILEVPKIIQKVLEYVRKPQLAIWEEFKLQKIPEHIIKKNRKSNKSVNFVCLTGALLEPYWMLQRSEDSLAFGALCLRWSVLGALEVPPGTRRLVRPWPSGKWSIQVKKLSTCFCLNLNNSANHTKIIGKP